MTPEMICPHCGFDLQQLATITRGEWIAYRSGHIAWRNDILPLGAREAPLAGARVARHAVAARTAVPRHFRRVDSLQANALCSTAERIAVDCAAGCEDEGGEDHGTTMSRRI